jgi:hypothetical protein
MHPWKWWLYYISLVNVANFCNWVQARYFVHTCYLVFYLKTQKKTFFQTSNLPLVFQNKWNFSFFMGISSLPLAFKRNLCHIIWTWKSIPKISPKVSPIFLGLGMILVTKTNSVNHIYIYMLTTSILRYLKKNQILAKAFHLLSSTWTLFFKLPQILGMIQVLANSF